jgi:hypothetical protein
MLNLTKEKHTLPKSLNEIGYSGMFNIICSLNDTHLKKIITIINIYKQSIDITFISSEHRDAST